MKRNLFPLLGIAFVVAIAATGIFYGLFVGKMEGAGQNQPGPGATPVVVAVKPLDRGVIVTPADVRLEAIAGALPAGAFTKIEEVTGRTLVQAVAAKEPISSANLASAGALGRIRIPKGMRAISIRASDSVGLLPFVRAGQRIDIQSVEGQNGTFVARTLLSNVEVLNVHPEITQNGTAAAVLNLLVPATDVERVALADSAAKVRIVLRNADDEETAPVSKQTPKPGYPGTKVTGMVGAAPPATPDVQFVVKMAAAPAEVVRQIGKQEGVQFGLMPKDWPAVGTKLLVTRNIDVAHWHGAEVRASEGDPGYDLRLTLTPRGAHQGRLRLRVTPEYSIPQRGGVSHRKFTADLDVAEGQSVIVAGFERDAAVPALLDNLFRGPEAKSPGSELLVMVTPRMLTASR